MKLRLKTCKIVALNVIQHTTIKLAQINLLVMSPYTKLVLDIIIKKYGIFFRIVETKKNSQIFCGEKIKLLVMCQSCVAVWYLTSRNNNFIKSFIHLTSSRYKIFS